MQTAKLFGEPVRVYDDSLKGFGFTAAKRGGGSFFIEYRLASRGPHPQRYRLGALGPLKPSTAREMAQQLLGDVARGVDIQAKKDAERDRAQSIPFSELWMEYFDYREKREPSKYWRELRSVYRRHIPQVIANRPIEFLARTDLRRALDLAREKAPSAEQWLYDGLGGMFAWAVERGLLRQNPAEGLRPPPPRKRRERVLSEDELRAVMRAADSFGYPWRPLWLLLVLTGARLNEVAQMRWTEIDLPNALWTIPSARTKNKHTHELELPLIAVWLLTELRIERDKDKSVRKDSPFVLTTNGRTSISGISKAKRALDAASDVQDWRIHDFRRCFATSMAEHLEIDEGIIERLLNHRTAQGGLKGIYNRAQHRQKRRAAMTAWGRYVEALLSVQPRITGAKEHHS